MPTSMDASGEEVVSWAEYLELPSMKWYTELGKRQRREYDGHEGGNVTESGDDCDNEGERKGQSLWVAHKMQA